jgi:hypothetical protein
MTPATTRTDATDLTRALGFERAQQIRAGATSTPHPLGRLVRHPGHPGYWSLNELQVHEPVPAHLDAPTIVRAADEAQGDLPHRRVFVDDDVGGARLAEGLAAGGWDCTRDVYMALRRTADRAPTAPARVSDLDTLLVAKQGVLAETVARHERDVIAGGTRAMATPGTRFVVADHDGAPAAYATLYSDGAVAHQLIFLVADADDWPRELYARLGFDPVGHCWAFVRPPATD